MIRLIEKAGVVAFTEGGKILICTTLSDMSKWVLPKGHCEEGETHQQTAVREAEEELGWVVQLLSQEPCGELTRHLFYEKVQDPKDLDGPQIEQSVSEHILFYPAEIISRVNEGERPILFIDQIGAILSLHYREAKEIVLQAIKDRLRAEWEAAMYAEI